MFGVTGRVTACPASTPSEWLVAWQGPASPTRTSIDSRACSAAASLQTARIPKASGHRDLFRTQGGERSGPSDRAARGRRATTDGEPRRHVHLETTHPWSSIFGRTSVPKGTAKEKGPRTAAVVCGMGPATHNSAGDSADEGVGPVIGGSGHPLSNVEDEVPETGHGRGAGGSQKKQKAPCASRNASAACSAAGSVLGGGNPSPGYTGTQRRLKHTPETRADGRLAFLQGLRPGRFDQRQSDSQKQRARDSP